MIPSENQILEKLKDVEDPELHVNVVDLGLIYNIQVGDGGEVDIEMTFTTPFCPYGASLEKSVKESIEGVEGVNKVGVLVVFDPPWSAQLMSEEAKLDLGLI